MGTRHYTRELYTATLKYLRRDDFGNLTETWHRRKVEWFNPAPNFSTKLNLRLLTSAQYEATPKN